MTAAMPPTTEASFVRESVQCERRGRSSQVFAETGARVERFLICRSKSAWTTPTDDSVNVHWSDLALSLVEIKVDSRSTLTTMEMISPTGSCPYLYAWDGKRFRFITDILGASPLGLRLTDDRFIEADTDELVWIGNEDLLKPRDGDYVLQVTEELRE
jgi:hypothetical protein